MFIVCVEIGMQTHSKCVKNKNDIVTVLKAWILNDLHQQSESSKIKNLLKEKFLPFMAFI